MDARLNLNLHDLTREASIVTVPPESPLPMPTQDLRQAPEAAPLESPHIRTWLSRVIVAGGTLAITSYGVFEILSIVGFGNMTIMQGVLAALLATTLGWIGLAACSSIAGVLVGPRRHGVEAALEGTRTALLMPVYNEDPTRTTAALRAMSEALAAQAAAQHFEIMIISDTTDADVWIAEALAVERLREQLRDIMPVWYRRRWRNHARKAGNVEDFVRRWGGRYDFMIVLDADSLMDAPTLTTLVARMHGDPQLGILQTVPTPMGQWSLFARLQQFAGRVYGGIVTRGVAAWSGNDGNYWGHNAIIRVAAFASSCGLPQLSGRKPFGGHVLSHDFVEAALMRRSGWKVQMAHDLHGSWEESPPSLLDVAIRDRRWAQGNLQHMKVIGASGLHSTSRLHIAIGIMSYLSSPLWMLLLIVGFALTVQATLFRPEYFSQTFQLFPNWPRFDAERMVLLFLFSMTVLFTPKVLGVLYTLAVSRARKGCGGLFRLPFSVVIEVILSSLYAPVMMVLQTRHVLEILTGRDSGWGKQRRDATICTWSEAWEVHWHHLLIGLITGVLAWFLSPSLFFWLSPCLLGLVLSVPLAKISASVAIGRGLARLGLLRTPEETELPDLIHRRNELAEQSPPIAEDGLRLLARDRGARLIHSHSIIERPPETRGHPDPQRLTAQQKVVQARTLHEALEWLNGAERVHVAGDAHLLELLAELPDEETDAQTNPTATAPAHELDAGHEFTRGPIASGPVSASEFAR
jgi:membrane glycosyltransferase